MLELFRAENIFDVARPLHRISRVFGLTAFAILENEGREWKAKVTFLSFIWVLLLSAYLSTLSIYFIFNFEKLMFVEEILLTKVIRITMILVSEAFLVNAMLIMITVMLARKAIVRAFNIIADFDEEISNLAIYFKYKKQKIFITSIIYGWLSVSIIAMIFSTFMHKIHASFKMDPFLLVSLCGCINLNYFFEFQFIFMLWNLKIRFKAINNILWKNFNGSVRFQDDFKKIKILNLIARMHELLVFASEAVSDGFGVAVS